MMQASRSAQAEEERQRLQNIFDDGMRVSTEGTRGGLKGGLGEGYECDLNVEIECLEYCR
jgi:hypothetical protein